MKWIVLVLIVLAVVCFLYMYTQPNRQVYTIIALHLLWIAALLMIFMNNVVLAVVGIVLWLYLTACLQVYWRVVYYGMCARGPGDYSLWSKGMKSIFYSTFRVERFTYFDGEKVPLDPQMKNLYSEPVIYALTNNHASDFFEILALPLVSEDAVIVSASTSKPIQEIIRNNSIFVDNHQSKNFEKVSQEAKGALHEGRSVLLFPENGRSARKKKDSGDFFAWWRRAWTYQTGAFRVAVATGTPVVPVVVEKYAFSEGLPWVGSTIRVHFLEKIYPPEGLVEDPVEWMRDEYSLRLQTFLPTI